MESIDQEQALLLFSKLESEGAEVACLGFWPECKVALSGKVSVRSDEVSVSTADSRGRIVLRVDIDDLLFWRWEAGEMSPDEGAPVPRRYWGCSCISVSLPLRVPLSMLKGPLLTPRRDKLIFLELKEGIVADGSE